MDDIIRPGRPTNDSGSSLPVNQPEPDHFAVPVTRGSSAPEVDVAGVVPRRPAPLAAAMHIPEPTASEPVAPTPVAEPASVPEPALNLPATELDGSVSNLNESLDSEGQQSSEPPMPATAPSPSLLAEIEAEEVRENDAKVTQAPKSAGHKKSHLPMIIIAVIMALGLIAGAGYAYLQNNKTKPAPATTNTAPKEEAKNPATAEDVDKASSDIDAAIKEIDETKENSEADLSDTTLGL